MRILITGASGLIGTALAGRLAADGHEILHASRSAPKDARHVRWDAETGFAGDDLARLEGLDAVVHLAGESIGGGLRWSEEKKRAIRDSRVEGTRRLVADLARLTSKPGAFVASSAIGFYGNRGDELLDEMSGAGDTFLAETCKAWETESRRAEDVGIRTALIRTGIVLSKNGGALATMLTPFKMGVGGVIGSGKQWMSWIALDDIVRIYEQAIINDDMRGAYNATAPNPVTNAEFTSALGKELYRPTILPLPEFAVNLIFGEMGDALLLDSTRVVPKRLSDGKFEFLYPDLPAALRHALQ
jgi:uncharacterized protein